MFGFGKKEKPAAKPAAKASSKAATTVAEPPAETHQHGDLKVKVADRKACAVTLAVTVPPSRVEEETQESFRRIQGKAKLPGFRPGKAPLDMVKKHFDGAAREDALDRLLRETVHEALEKEKVMPVVTPTVDKIEYDLGKPLKYELKVECAPDVELKQYKGLAVEKSAKPVTDEDVTKRLDELREHNAKLIESKDVELAAKHFAVVDYVGTLDGQPVDGGKAESQLIELGAEQGIAGFSEGLKGAKAGETREVPVKFPDDHPNKALSGKQVVFKVTVTAIKEKQLPAADDEFAKDLGVESFADLSGRIRKNLEQETARAERQKLEKQVSDRLIEQNPFDVPPSLVAERTQQITANLKQYLMRQGAGEEEWKANEPRMLEKNKVEAERQVRLSYLLTAIGEKEKIEVTEADVDELVKKTIESSEPARRGQMEKWLAQRRGELEAQLREEKIFTLLIDSAKATAVKA